MLKGDFSFLCVFHAEVLCAKTGSIGLLHCFMAARGDVMAQKILHGR